MNKRILWLWFVALLSSFTLFFFFLQQHQFPKIYANYDGPNYLVVAKCGYNPQCIRRQFSLPLPLEYYPAHFPGFPVIIRLIDQIFHNYLLAGLIATLLGTLFMVTVFYQLLIFLRIPRAFWLSVILLFLPARNFILHSIIAPEPWFVGFLLLTILAFRKKNFLLAGLSLALAQSIKTPAILLFVALVINLFIENKFKFSRYLKAWPLLLGPLVVFPIFWLFQQQTGDFWAYFHSGDNIHLSWLPYQVFITPHQRWIGTIWLEDIIYIYLLGGLAIAYLIKKYKTDIIAIFPLVFYLATLFIGHRDISRYSAPLYPFWIIAFAPILNSKEFKIVFFLLLPAIYLYAFHFISLNLAPISDWTPYL